MKTKKFYGYAPEINKLAKNHTGAILALYVEAFNDGMRVGHRNALIGASVVAAAGAFGLYVAVITYLNQKNKL